MTITINADDDNGPVPVLITDEGFSVPYFVTITIGEASADLPLKELYASIEALWINAQELYPSSPEAEAIRAVAHVIEQASKRSLK